MVLLAISFVVLVSAILVGYAIDHLVVHSKRGWERANEVQEQIITLQQARIISLENRLNSRTVEEYAQYQSSPDELTKTAFFDEVTRERQYHDQFEAVENDPRAELFRYSGADLEEGPVIG